MTDSTRTVARPYHEREKCLVCKRPAGPFGSCGFPDFCDCDQRKGITFASKQKVTK